MPRFSWCLAAATSAVGLCATADAQTDLDSVDVAVAAFTGRSVGEVGGALRPVDRRLRLADCAESLALSWYGATQTSVLVQCPEPGGWRVYVPVRRAAIAGSSASVVLPPVVARGDAVSIIVSGAGFAVMQSGTALDSGAIGAWIRVKTSQSAGSPLRAKVLRAGQVGMDLP